MTTTVGKAMRVQAFREQYERASEWPLTAAAVVFLAAYAWPVLDVGIPVGLEQLCSAVTVAIWLVFGADYLLRLVLASERWSYVRAHLLDLIVLSLPLLRPLRALRVITVLGMLNRRAAVSLRGQAMTYVVGGVGLLGFIAAVAVLDAERSNPDANITTFGDAAWWAGTTITTVGYGDRYPTTGEGRFVGLGLMVGGIALLGVVTAALASWFVEHVQRTERTDAAQTDQLASLLAEVRALRRELDPDPVAGSESVSSAPN